MASLFIAERREMSMNKRCHLPANPFLQQSGFGPLVFPIPNRFKMPKADQFLALFIPKPEVE